MPAPLPSGYRSQHIVISIEYLKQALAEKTADTCDARKDSAQGFIQAFNPALYSMPHTPCEEYADNRQFGKRRRGSLS